MNSRMKVIFDDSISNDTVIAWNTTVPLFKESLFNADKEKRKEIIKKKIIDILPLLIEKIEEEINSEINEVKVSLASAWVRYYVFKLEVNDEHSFALNLLSPNSPVKSFKNHWEDAVKIYRRFPRNVAKPIAVGNEFLLQEWINGTPISEFREGDIMVDVENAKKCIPLVSRFLFELNKFGYVYHPWEDYEVMLRNGDIVLLDVTRFVKKRLNEEEFIDFYFGVPFCSPDIIKPKKDDPSVRLYWKGVSEKDYFGTSKKEYIKLFLEGIKSVATEDEFKKICKGIRKWI